MALAHSDLFALLAEVSATFVGFSLVIGLLQPDNPRAGVRLRLMQSIAESDIFLFEFVKMFWYTTNEY